MLPSVTFVRMISTPLSLIFAAITRIEFALQILPPFCAYYVIVNCYPELLIQNKAKIFVFFSLFFNGIFVQFVGIIIYVSLTSRKRRTALLTVAAAEVLQ